MHFVRLFRPFLVFHLFHLVRRHQALEEEIFQPLEEDICGLFLDFSVDLWQQGTDLGTESETNPAGEFADNIYLDYQYMPAVQPPVTNKKKQGQPVFVPIEKFYFLLVQPVEKEDRIRVCGYVYSEQFWDNHYLKHVRVRRFGHDLQAFHRRHHKWAWHAYLPHRPCVSPGHNIHVVGHKTHVVDEGYRSGEKCLGAVSVKETIS